MVVVAFGSYMTAGSLDCLVSLASLSPAWYAAAA